MKPEDVTLEMVKNSDFGCRNCLYYSCECNNGIFFSPRVVKLGKVEHPSCTHYGYYD